MQRNPEEIKALMSMTLSDLIATLAGKGGGGLEIEVEPVEGEEEEEDSNLTRKKGRNGRLGPTRGSKMNASRMFLGKEDDEESSMGGCCGFDDQDHIGSSYT
jgi:hypothetical protein